MGSRYFFFKKPPLFSEGLFEKKIFERGWIMKTSEF